jgi:Gas vesicle protein K
LRLEGDAEHIERGLAQLVLTLIELVRQLMERQAIRRVDAGGLNDEQVERLGKALIALEDRMEELKLSFGLTDDELNLELGPLGRLVS